jgi:tetratricopeptide (TPR) repeat protein
MAEQSIASPSTQQLLAVIGSVRRQAMLVWLASTIVGVIGTGVLLLVLAVALDQYLQLPAAMRVLLLLAVIAGPIAVLRASLKRKPDASPEETALLIEQRYPDLDNVLINTLQLTHRVPTGSESIVAAIAADAGAALGAIRPGAAVPKRTLNIAMALLAAGGIIFVAMALRDSDALSNGLNRMLVPLANNSLTRIVEVTPGTADVLVYNDVPVTVTLDGHVVTEAELTLTYEDGRTLALTMLPESPSRRDKLTTTIRRLEENVTYRVRANDAKSQTYNLSVHQRPAIAKIVQRVGMPDYTGRTAIERTGGSVEALAGSTVTLDVYASEPLSKAYLRRGEGEPVEMQLRTDDRGTAIASTSITVDRFDRYSLELTSALGFPSEPVQYDIVPVDDALPQVVIKQPVADMDVSIDATLDVEVQATDDFGVRELNLWRLPPAGDTVAASGEQPQRVKVQAWTNDKRDGQTLTQTLRVSLAELGLSEEQPVILQASATDFRPDAPEALSSLLTLRLKGTEAAETAAQTSFTNVSLDALIALQRTNIAATQAHEQSAGMRTDDTRRATLEATDAIVARQEQIHKAALDIVTRAKGAEQANPMIADRIGALSSTLMVVAIEQLRTSVGSRKADDWSLAVGTQEKILSDLLKANTRQDESIAEYQQRELAEALRDLIARQTVLRTDTSAKSASGGALSARQRVLGRDAAVFQRQVQAVADTGASGNPTLAAVLGRIATGFNERRIRETMVIAASNLADDALADAMPRQDKVLVDLAELEKLFQEAAKAQAKEELEETMQSMEEAQERLDKMTELQKAVVEIATELKAAKDQTATDKEFLDADLKDLEEMRENIENALEQLVTDMHLIPDMDASNDILMELAEVYEEVRQKKGSENSPASEQAVDRDEGLLAAFKAMQKKMGERIGDLEMWLSDAPESGQWNMESYDRDEMGKVPLGDLPDALEDIVGDLLEQAEEIEKQAEDSLSNQAIPDGLMGWDIDDGPMPSWAAKGKSGNKRPDQFEQTGRSGAGRQGESSGEIVGDTIKALEGSDVRERRTNDSHQAGELNEENPDAMDTKATGGGKGAGVADGEGMDGDAPPKDELKYRDMARTQMKMQRDAESVISKAKLLRLPTGELDRAALEMAAAQKRLEAGDIQGFVRTQKEVIKSLRETHARLTGKPVTDGNADRTRTDPNIAGATAEPVPQQYEDAVAAYMRRIAESD